MELYTFYINLVSKRGEEPKDLGSLLVERGLATREQHTTSGGDEYTSYSIDTDKVPNENLADDLKRLMHDHLGGSSIALETSGDYKPNTYRFYTRMGGQCLADCISKMLPDEILRVRREAPYFDKHYVLLEKDANLITRTGRPASCHNIMILKNNLFKEIDTNPNKVMVNISMDFDGESKWVQFELYKDCIMPFYWNEFPAPARYSHTAMVFDAEKYNVKVNGQNIVMTPEEIQRRYYKALGEYTRYMNTWPQLPITQDISLHKVNQSYRNENTNELVDNSFYIVKLPILLTKQNQDITHISFTTPVANIENQNGTYREAMDLPKNGHYQNVILWRGDEEANHCQIQVKEMITAYKNYLKDTHREEQLATIDYLETVRHDQAVEDERRAAGEDYDYEEDDMERD